MPQETNLNVSPYFDDYYEPIVGGKDKDYYKVLFKPGYPVQARELTTLQSILQNQVEQFGTHFFKEGAKVIPGQTSYNNQVAAIQIEDEFAGIPVSLYLNELVGKKITGSSTNIKAQVDKVLFKEDSERGTHTLYISYLTTSTVDNSSSRFLDSETLLIDETLSFGNSFISAGQGFATTVASNSSSTAAVFTISSGVYFVRGFFVQVNDEIIILDQYSNTPSCRVGLLVNEEVISSDIDPFLNDNAQGFNNYAAPGADRLKITVSLFKKDIDDFNDQNFIELSTIRNGVVQSVKSNTEYNLLADEFARRTYDESGDYYIKPFDVSCKESLKDGLGNGIFNSNQITYSGNTPSEDLAVYQISPGKAFIRGYEVETLSPTFLDVRKPRTTKTLENQSIIYSTGNSFTLNRVYGTPNIGIGNTYVLSLRNQRTGVAQTEAQGDEIGVARVYDFALESGSYNTSSPQENQWDISLYDIQTYTQITLNEPISLSIPTFVKGKSSGAKAFLKEAVSSSKALTLYQREGSFYPNEQLIFDGIENTRISIAVTEYNTSDVKSLYGIVGTANTFSSDIILSPTFNIGQVTIGAYNISSGISTATTTNKTLPNNLRVNDIIRYSRAGFETDSFARVTSVGITTFSVTGVTTVSGICDGAIPPLESTFENVQVIRAFSQNSQNSLFTPFPKANVSDVDVTNSTLSIRKQDTVTITGGELQVTAGTDEVFQPFDEERYILIRADGGTESLSADQFDFGVSGGTQLTIRGLSTDGSARLISTRTKLNVKEKIKNLQRVSSLVIDKSIYEGSGIGSTTINDGLTYGNYPYGTRVQDEEICLNVPDITTVYRVYESYGTGDPNAPRITVASLDGPTTTTTDLILGEKITGSISGAIAIVVEKIDSNTIGYTPANSSSFIVGENISFEESGINGEISSLDESSIDISGRFTFDNGQRFSYYDYGRLIRRTGNPSPTKKIKVYYSYGYYDTSDTGDITTVNSYKSYDYSAIPNINSIKNSDIIDIRPRVADYTVSAGSYSPFEFNGRDFTTQGSSASNILASDENIILSYSFYLPRIDRVFLTKDGIFQVKYGTPAEKPELPTAIDNALEIARVNLPPFLYNTSSASISLLDYKRYRMVDIKNLEDRIKNLEYYTSLSLLESDTSNLFISDANGLNRYKSGFFVDNFKDFSSQNKSIGIKNSIDSSNSELRPSHYTTSLDLIVGSNAIIGIGTTSNPNVDLNYVTDLDGNNVTKNNGIITLDYNDVEWVGNPFATRVENVTPFLVKFWEGTIFLNPASDTWVDTTRLASRTVSVEGNYAATVNELSALEGLDPQTGLTPIVWNSWTTVWTGEDVTSRTERVNQTSESTSNIDRLVGLNDAIQLRDRFLAGERWSLADQNRRIVGVNEFSFENSVRRLRGESIVDRFGNTRPGFTGGVMPDSRVVGTEITTVTDVVDVTTTTTTRTGVSSRSGSRKVVTEQFDTESQGDRVISSEVLPLIRSRNVEFKSYRLKAYTRMYTFFDGRDVNQYCFPKLLEISMTSGTFQVGETIIGSSPAQEISAELSETNPYIQFRAAQLNHKSGPYNNPEQIYSLNPYDSTQTVPESYSSTSTLLNIDTFSLSEEVQGDFYGWVSTGTILRGQTSGAIAQVTNVRLVTDEVGSLIGSFFIPDPNISGNEQFTSGDKIFRLTSNSSNSTIPGIVSTIAEENFTSRGTIQTVQETILSVRNARVETQSLSESVNASESSTSQTRATVSSTTSSRLGRIDYTVDPLAQTFFVAEDTGVYVTKLDVFFNTKDSVLPVTCQIRSVNLGVPTQKVLPFSEVVLNPENVNVSDDASVATTFNFDAPVYLEAGKEYAIVLLSNSTEYNVWISRLGETEISTASNAASGQIIVSAQPLLGSLFKSQNASTWDASQFEDLKFTLYRASFVPNGNIQFYNPKLSIGNNQVATLLSNPLEINSRKIKVALASSISDSNLTIGNSILQDGSNFTGNLVGLAGSAIGDLNVINAGIGYTPLSGSFTFNGVSLVNITGSGRNATANITINNGVAVAATISNSGYGYVVGDIVGITTIGSSEVGRNSRFSIGITTGNNQLIIEDCQGEFVVGTSNSIKYVNNSGVTTYLNGSSGGTVYPISPVEVVNDGLHIKVRHKNHGMHSILNRLTLSNVKSDNIPTKLTVDYSTNGTETMNVLDSTNFGTFENVGVGTTNYGYLIIGNEIMSYETTSTGSIGITSRAIDGTKSFSYPAGTIVSKYELNGVSLRRINKEHVLSDSEVNESIGLDYYNIKINPDSQTGVDRTSSVGFPDLFFNETKSCGGINVSATQNIQFEALTPNIQNFTPNGTDLTTEVRTVTGTSVNGSEASFVDSGYSEISLNSTNYFDSPRIICSDVNEINSLSTLPGNKSFTMRFNLTSLDERLTPVIDTNRVNIITTSNRINNVIQNFATDGRSTSLLDDPTAVQYVTKLISLANPATSIKLIVGAHVNLYSDIRAFYTINNSVNTQPVFTPFPGYNNLDTRNQIISSENSDGLSDKFIEKSNTLGFNSNFLEFREYEFTADPLPSFTDFSIKIVMTSTNQAYVPRLKDLRVIALA